MIRPLPRSASQAPLPTKDSSISWLIRGISTVLLVSSACAGCLGSARPLISPDPAPFTPSPVLLPSPTETLAGSLIVSTRQATRITPSPVSDQICSPLQSVRLSELPEIVSNPYEPPQPGQDNGHHGTDFAFYRWGTQVGMLGLPVQSVFSGKVAAVLPDRPPYGNTAIVETSWDQLPAPIQSLYGSPPPTPEPGAIHLTCPEITQIEPGNSGKPSLYLLYAHLKEKPSLQIGQSVSCGEPIGLVGTTGASVNPHLHLETRFGPAGAVFTSMAHYTANASRAEMTAYCTWRVSGQFILLDPVKVLSVDTNGQ